MTNDAVKMRMVYGCCAIVIVLVVACIWRQQGRGPMTQAGIEDVHGVQYVLYQRLEGWWPGAFSVTPLYKLHDLDLIARIHSSMEHPVPGGAGMCAHWSRLAFVTKNRGVVVFAVSLHGDFTDSLAAEGLTEMLGDGCDESAEFKCRVPLTTISRLVYSERYGKIQKDLDLSSGRQDAERLAKSVISRYNPYMLEEAYWVSDQHLREHMPGDLSLTVDLPRGMQFDAIVGDKAALPWDSNKPTQLRLEAVRANRIMIVTKAEEVDRGAVMHMAFGHRHGSRWLVTGGINSSRIFRDRQDPLAELVSFCRTAKGIPLPVHDGGN